MDILEAKSKQFMSARETRVKEKLVKLLRDDGNGHKFEDFANRLAKFDLHIIYNSKTFTASVSWDEGIIRINNGFLQPDAKGKLVYFNQLSVLLRHELSHNLMMHQVRMFNKLEKDLGKEAANELLKLSESWHDLINWIEDFEISNKVYDGGKDFDATVAGKKRMQTDKYIVENMVLYGRVISGLITEDFRPDWQHMSLEEMYDAMAKDYEKLNNQIKKEFSTQRNGQTPDYVGNAKWAVEHNNGFDKKMRSLYFYADPTNKHNYVGSVDEFVKHDGYFNYVPDPGHVAKLSALPDEWVKTINDAYNYLSKKTIDPKDAEDMLNDIAISMPMATVALSDKEGKVFCTLYCPEEKLFVGDMIRYYLDEDYYLPDYDRWFNKVTKVFKKYSYTDDEIRKIIDGIK